MPGFLDLSAIPLAIVSCSTIAALSWEYVDRRKEAEVLQREIRLRIKSWWIICGVFLIALYGGAVPTILLFGIISFLALREYLNVAAPGGGYPLLFLSIIVQYILIAKGQTGPLGLYQLAAGLLLAVINCFVLSRSHRNIASVARLYFGVIICVLLVSAAPALLILPVAAPIEPLHLLFYLLILTGLSDVFQFCVGKPFGRHKIVPSVSPHKSWEGLVGGTVLTAVAACFLGSITPYSICTDAGIGAAICLAGFFGGLTLSNIKRDFGKKNFGELLPGHGGVLDRIDSLCFTAPLFYYFVKYTLT